MPIMFTKESHWSRRHFLKATGTAGLGALMAPVNRLAAAAETPTRVPTRPFGKTGVDVSILSLGGMFDIASNQLMMRQALDWGVTYWDTADCYQKGSEKGIWKYFKKYPQDRQRVFLVSKTELSVRDTNLLQRHAAETQSDYCTGCTNICQSAVGENIPIGDVMRYLMYCRSYGDWHLAMAAFNKIPEKIRRRLADTDYSMAEEKCPQNMAIGQLMKAAIKELS